MTVRQKLVNLCFCWMKRNLAKPKYQLCGKNQLTGHSDLNLIFTDVRADGVRQKAKSFFTIVNQALELGLTVSVVVHTQIAHAKQVKAIYREVFHQFEERSGFNVVVAPFTTASASPISLLVLVLTLYLRLIKNGSKVTSDFSIITASFVVRQWQFSRIFDDFPTRAWLGLTGGVELPAFAAQRDYRGSNTTVSALQFGQVSEDQYHFEGYKVDNLFVYDDYARQEMGTKVAESCKLIVSGSPEFEYELGRLHAVPTRPFSGRVEVLFIDQPLQQRSEFDSAFVRSLEKVLRDFSVSQSFSVAIKAHPRGSAFTELPSQLYFTGDIVELLPHAHVVVTCFSNLADLSVLMGARTVYVGADKVLATGKLSWIRENGGTVLDRPEDLGAELESELQQLERNDPDTQRRPPKKPQRTASQVIISQILRSNAA